MTSNINNNNNTTTSIRIESLEKHVHKWIVFSLKLIELWQNSQHDKRKIKLKKILLSNQCQKSISKEFPRIVDMFFEIENHSISSNDQNIIMSFCEEFTTIRILLNDITPQKDANEPLRKFNKINYNSQPLFKLTFDNL